MKAIKWLLLVSTLFKLSLGVYGVSYVLDTPDTLADKVLDVLHEDAEYKENLEETRETLEFFSFSESIVGIRAILFCIADRASRCISSAVSKGLACEITKISVSVVKEALGHAYISGKPVGLPSVSGPQQSC